MGNRGCCCEKNIVMQLLLLCLVLIAITFIPKLANAYTPPDLYDEWWADHSSLSTHYTYPNNQIYLYDYGPVYSIILYENKTCEFKILNTETLETETIKGKWSTYDYRVTIALSAKEKYKLSICVFYDNTISHLVGSLGKYTNKQDIAFRRRADIEKEINERKRQSESLEKRNNQADASYNIDDINLLASQSVFFGSYDQNGDSSEKIEWTVLDVDKEANKALLISKYGLDAVSYGTPMDVSEYSQGRYSWKKSYLREWLNNDFLTTAFSREERMYILDTEIQTNDAGGNDSSLDRIFCLSIEEAEKYFSDAVSMGCFVTETAKKKLRLDQGAVNEDDLGNWWLRNMVSVYTPAGQDSFMENKFNEAAFVSGAAGLVNAKEGKGSPVFCDYLITVRPAMWVDLMAIGDQIVQTNDSEPTKHDTKSSIKILSEQEYNTYALIFLAIVKGTLNNPESLQVHNVKVMEYNGDSYIVIDFSAMNVLGGYTRTTYSFAFEENHISLSGTSSDYSAYSMHKDDFSLIMYLDADELVKQLN